MSSSKAGDDAPPASLGRAVLLCNSKSRRGREWYPAVQKRLEDEGFELERAENFKHPAQIKAAVDEAVKDKVPLIIVGGGDGTMSLTAPALKGSESILGVIPLGTGNAFARDLGIPSDVDGACKVLVEGVAQRVDLGVAGGKHFVNVATVGLTALIAQGLTDAAKKRLGRFVYATAIMRAVAVLKPFQATLTTTDGAREFETMQIVFGSGRFHAGPFPVTPDAEITDHVLNGYALKGTSKGSLLKYAFKLWGGHHIDLPEVEQFTVKAATLSTRPIKQVVIDGELTRRTPIELHIDAAAVKVMVANDFSGMASSD
jgi:diacylglycerol kinase (ATP)